MRRGNLFLSLCPPTHTQRKGHLRTQQEGSCLKASKRTPTRNQIILHLHLELLSLRNYEKLKPLRLRYFVWQPKKKKCKFWYKKWGAAVTNPEIMKVALKLGNG